MTVDPFDDLERQLRRRVAEARGGRRSRWRAHPFLAVLAVGAVTASGVAVAAGGLKRGPDDAERGKRIAFEAISSTTRDRVCRAPRFVKDGPVTFLDGAPPAAVLNALPWMRVAASAAEQRAATRALEASHPVGGSQVLRSTLRMVRLDQRWSLAIRVDRGQGGFSVADPDACRELRRKRLEQRLVGEDLGVRESARRQLALDMTANPAAMTFWVFLLSRGQPTSGAGQPLLPGPGTGPRYELHPGLLMNSGARIARGKYGSGSGGGRYLGLADPTTVRIAVWSPRADVRRALPRTIAVHRGFWRLEVPGGTGPIRLTEIGADGRKGRMVRLRG